jgi:hypothetical protein
VCTPNESKCNQAGTAIETCKADGLGVVIQNCPEGSTICEDATCKAIICSADTTFCDGTTVKQCNSTGTAAEDFADCDPEKQACLGGACVNKSCTPGTAVCNGLSEVQTCNANGLGFTATDCGNGFACKDGECNKQVCTPNTILCVGTEIHQCGTLGLTASQVKDCAGQGKVCLNGVCTDQICTPSTSYCNGNKVMQCDATGISESIKQTCSSDQYCASGGSCKAQVCTPNSVFCDGQKLMTCNANGSGSETTKDCAATGKFCIENACVDAPPGSKDNPALSCKAILDAQASTGDGTYWIDPDEAGANQSFQVYCDMTTDNGGWTLIHSSNGVVGYNLEESTTEPHANQFTINPTSMMTGVYTGWESVDQLRFACDAGKDGNNDVDFFFTNATEANAIYALFKKATGEPSFKGKSDKATWFDKNFYDVIGKTNGMTGGAVLKWEDEDNEAELSIGTFSGTNGSNRTCYKVGSEAQYTANCFGAYDDHNDLCSRMSTSSLYPPSVIGYWYMWVR